MNYEALEDLLGAIQLNGSNVFADVMTAVDEQTVIKNGIVKRDSAFVIPMADEARGEAIHTMYHAQDIATTVGIIYSVRAINDVYGRNVNSRLKTIKDAARKAIAGYQIDELHDPFNFASGEGIAFMKGGIFWMDIFTTTYRFDQE
jgi:vacuolar-type H+-ATPase subunit E/Vma4